MKKILFAMTFLGFGISSLTFAQDSSNLDSAAHGFDGAIYSRISGAWINLNDSDFIADPTSGNLGEFKYYDTGWGVSGAIGYAFSNGLRAEAEFNYHTADLSAAYVSGLPRLDGSGDIQSVSGMANVWYDINNKSRFTPFVGGGIGVAHVTYDATFDGGLFGIYHIDDDDTVFAYQLGGGVSVDLNEKVQLQVMYKYFVADDLNVFVTNANEIEEVEHRAHSVYAGFSFKLYD